MFKSKEIRWFKSTEDQQITKWFEQHGQTFNNTEARTDFYLPLDKKDVALKLREGKIEIKHRVGEVIEGQLTSSAKGVFENWIKWSFNADEADKLTKDIITTNKYNWVEITKTRIGVKVAEDSTGNLEIHPIKAFIDNGCQIEYTLLEMHGKTFFSFALEWFGNQELTLPQNFINEILGSTQFIIEDSMGYGEFII
jgi:hypothetical protein